ncbi:glycosyl transferase [Orrella marina]|uniref:Glycosyl transferase n=2 Tax=Orrella marina TaxID=2163011 RepID=A0A2R4XHY2_9BURK|nr:glycosyl transferase [Orrella marina]
MDPVFLKKPRRLSIIIPVLNEASVIAQTLASLQPMRKRGVEVIVVDGGSQDSTVVRCMSRVDRFLSSPPGRARQMNVGARHAQGEILVFLHADTLLPDDADLIIERALTASVKSHKIPVDHSHDRPAWGRFDVAIDGRHWMLMIIAFMMNMRSRLTHICTGDQTIFMIWHTFDTTGGFPEQPLMEDIALSSRLKKRIPPVCLRHKVRTSGRRWEKHGVWRTIWLMWELRWRYWRGESASNLAKRYR